MLELSSQDWQAITTSLQLASVTTVLLLLLGTPLALWLAGPRNWLKDFVAVLVALPLVLPPTVLGFYLLILMSPQGYIGQLTQALGLGSFLFSFPGLLLGSMVYSLPFVVQPLQNAFQAIGSGPVDAAKTLGAGPLDRFFNVLLPMAKPGVISASVLGFAHTIGEFGVVLMIGGNIPGKTQVISVALYEHVEMLQYQSAHQLALFMLVFAFIALFVLYRLNSKQGGTHVY